MVRKEQGPSTMSTNPSSVYSVSPPPVDRWLVVQAVFAEGGYATNEPRDFEGDASTGGLGPTTGIYFPKLRQQQEQPLSVCRSASVRTLTHKLIYRTDPQARFYCCYCLLSLLSLSSSSFVAVLAVVVVVVGGREFADGGALDSRQSLLL